jgi:hypothetical protein
MKLSGTFTLLAALGAVTAHPTAETVDHVAVPPLAPNGYNASATLYSRGELAALGCIIRSYGGNNCQGNNVRSYDFSTQGCRSCERFDTSHSFSMEGTCPSGRFFASDNDCGRPANNPSIGFSGPGCYNVNTGYNWVTGWPCFTG